MKVSASISTLVALLLVNGPVLAAREADDKNEDDGTMLRRRAGVRAGDVDIEAGVKADDVVVEAGVKADGNIVKNTNGLLRSIYDEYMPSSKRILRPAEETASNGAWNEYLVWRIEANAEPKLLLTVISQAEGAEALLLPAFEAYGFESTGCTTYMCSGFLPVVNIPGFEARPEVRAVKPSITMTDQAGSKISEAVKSLQVDTVRTADPSLTGAGLKIGVLSDSFNNNPGVGIDYAADVRTKDLPPNITVLAEYLARDSNGNLKGKDEGRAMAQLIHDIAPGAQIYFHTAALGPPSFATGIKLLADAGCNVIIDDVRIGSQPIFQDVEIAKAANDVAELRGVPYFSSAGNNAMQSWEGTFLGSGTFNSFRCEIHDFGGGVTRQRVESIGGFVIDFQWDDPFFSASGSPGATRDLDIFLYNSSGVLVSAGTDINNGTDAYEELFARFAGIYEIEISFCTNGTSPPFMKWISSTPMISIAFDTKSPTSFGHKNQPYTAGVGAANFPNTPAFNGGNPPKLASYSSLGGIRVLLDRKGNRLSMPEDRQQPRFVATDGVITTFFGQDTNLPPNYPPRGGEKYFFGTSAAAPNAAAVAILMLQVNRTLTPLQVYDILAKTAIDMGPAGFDRNSGAGYIDANAAVNMVKGTTQPTQPSQPTLAPNPGPTLAPAPQTQTPTLAPNSGPITTPAPAPQTQTPTLAPNSGPITTPAPVPQPPTPPRTLAPIAETNTTPPQPLPRQVLPNPRKGGKPEKKAKAPKPRKRAKARKPRKPRKRA